jgi:peptidoglycan hydrolase CwlO-like protein
MAWAIAASAIAVIALISAGDNSKGATTTPATDLTPRVDKLERDTNARLDAFSRRLNDKAAATDVQKLDKRLTKAEDDASQTKDDVSKQGDTITQLQADVKDLQQRVDDLEAQQQGQGTTTTP